MEFTFDEVFNSIKMQLNIQLGELWVAFLRVYPVQFSTHGTTISVQRTISQCLFMTPTFNKSYNDPSSLLPQSPGLFIVTGNYTMGRLHHFRQQGLQLTGRSSADVLGTTSSFSKQFAMVPIVPFQEQKWLGKLSA